MLHLLLALAVTAGADATTIRVVHDVKYLAGANYPDNKDALDLYLPEGRDKAPVIVYYYGGALQEGDKADEAGTSRRFAAAGIATVAVNYRLSPAVSHPAHIQDAAASFAWVKAHIAEYGGDPQQIFLVGHSAGAYLAALLATDPRYLAAHHLSSREIRGVVPISAFFWVERAGVAPDRPKSVWGTDKRVWEDASPAHHLRADLPPLLLLYADGDEPWRRQQNVEMADALRAAGDDRVAITMIANRTHMSIWAHLKDEDDPASNAVIAFVRAKSAAQGRR